MDRKVTVIPVVIDVLDIVTKIIGKGTERLENKRTCGHHPNYSIAQNTKKRHGDLRRHAVIKILVKTIS